MRSAFVNPDGSAACSRCRSAFAMCYSPASCWRSPRAIGLAISYRCISWARCSKRRSVSRVPPATRWQGRCIPTSASSPRSPAASPVMSHKSPTGCRSHSTIRPRANSVNRSATFLRLSAHLANTVPLQSKNLFQISGDVQRGLKGINAAAANLRAFSSRVDSAGTAGESGVPGRLGVQQGERRVLIADVMKTPKRFCTVQLFLRSASGRWHREDATRLVRYCARNTVRGIPWRSNG